MNREIRFKGKTDNGKWLYGSLFCFGGKYYILQDVNNELGEHYCLHLLHTFLEDFEVIPETVCEFIGLKDENGVDIYEDDIMQHPSGEKFLITYYTGSCQFRADYGLGNTGNIGLQIGGNGRAIVIGNINDNPKLLQEQS